MRKHLFIILAIAAAAMLSSCCASHPHANYTAIDLAPGETVKVVVSGCWVQSAGYLSNQTQVDSAFVVSSLHRHSVEVTGCKLGCDTLEIMYGTGIFVNGERFVIPVTCVER